MGPSFFPWGPGAEPRHDDKRRSHVLGQFPQGRPTPSPYQTTTPSTSHPNSSAALGVTYTSYYLRRTYRQDGKVKHETLGNLSDLPLAVIDLIRRSLKGETFVPASE